MVDNGIYEQIDVVSMGAFQDHVRKNIIINTNGNEKMIWRDTDREWKDQVL